MFNRLGAAVFKEWLSFWRDPGSRRMVLAIPVIQVFLYAYAASLEVRSIDIAVMDEDNGRWSHEFIARIGASSFVGDLVSVNEPAELAGMISHRQVVMALHFPADFSRDIVASRHGAVQLLIDGRRANEGQIALAYIRTVAAQLGAELRASQHSPGSRPHESRPQANVRHWFNPNLEYTWFMIPNLGATLALIVPLMMTALSIARERELGTYDQLLVSPLTSSEIIAGKIIPAMFAGIFISVVVTGMAVFGFDIPYMGSYLLQFLSLLVFVLSVVGIGLVISAFCQTQQQAILGTFGCIIPFMLISGFVTPVENMPGWLQVIAEASPLKHFLIVIQGSLLKSMTGAEVWSNTWPMLVIGSVTLSAAILIVRQRLQ